ncbi:MAG: LLM class flavin-dependent oxidoreductase [Solirubrobacteraceae bacterium]
MTRSLQLGVLDQSPVTEGSDGAIALRRSVDLAILAERLGYGRYWVAEHHGHAMIAGASPEVLIAAIAARTSSIRVGSGGVMLPHYSPLKVAENFAALCGLYPGRIDLGIGRAPGSDPHTMLALQRDRRQLAPDDFPEQLAELLAYLEDDFPAGHPLARLAALPGGPQRPEVWLLGSSPQSGEWAAQLGLPYAFADFFSSSAGAAIARRYRENFEPSRRRAQPHVAIAVAAICAESDAEAQQLASSLRMSALLRERGQIAPLSSVEHALAFLARQGDPPAAGSARRAIVGSPEIVRAGLEAVAGEYGADEVLIVTMTHDHGARRRSYELIADAFAMRGDTQAADPLLAS